MKSKASKAIVSALNGLREFIEQVNRDKGKESARTRFPDFSFSHADLGGLLLWDEEAREYRRCLTGLVEATSERTNLSQREIESDLQRAILSTLDITKKQPGVAFVRRLNCALKELEALLYAPPVDWEIYIPIYGLAKNGLPQKLGEVELIHCDAVTLRNMRKQAASVIVRKGSAGKQLGTPGRHFFRNRDFLNQNFARIMVKASDGGAATLNAEPRIRQVIDLLNFYVGVLVSKDSRIFLAGDSASITTVVSLMKRGAKPSLHHKYSIKGPFIPLDLGRIVSHGNDYAFSEISRIFANNSINSLESRVLSAFIWAGRASVEMQKEHGFMLFMIALETILLGGKQRENITYKLKTRAAHMLGRNLGTRQKIVREVARLYGIRSEILHAGTFWVTDKELSAIAWYAKNCIVGLLMGDEFKDMKSEEDLEKWFETKVLS